MVRTGTAGGVTTGVVIAKFGRPDLEATGVRLGFTTTGMVWLGVPLVGKGLPRTTIVLPGIMDGVGSKLGSELGTTTTVVG
jgi:hypothetical protein